VNVDNGWPIRLAAIDGNASIVKLLLDHGADPRANEDQALIGAARRGRTAVVKLLLDSGPETYVYSKQVLGPAAGLGHTETVRVLLDYGADLHVDNDWPLRWATIEGHKSTVELLLERGANADAVDKGELEKLLKSPLERQLNKLQGEHNQLNLNTDCNIPDGYYFPEQDKAFFCDLDEQNFIFEDSNIK
jgi:ankyrin repeat protein